MAGCGLVPFFGRLFLREGRIPLGLPFAGHVRPFGPEPATMSKQPKASGGTKPAISLALDLGLGVLWAWMGVVWLGIPRIPGGLGIVWPVWLCFSAAVALALLLGPVWSKVVARLGVAQPAVYQAAAIACAVATLTLGTGWPGPSVSCVSAVISGAAASLLMLEWASHLSSYDEDRLELVIPLCSLVSVFVSCFSVLPDSAYWVACALLPVLSAATLVCRSKRGAVEVETDEPVAVSCPQNQGEGLDILRIALVTCATYALIKFVGGSPFDPSYAESGIWNGVPHLFGLLMAVAIAFLSLAHFSRLTMAAIMRVITPAVVIACLLLLLPGASLQLVSGILMAIAETPLVVFITLWAMGRAHRGQFDARSGFGLLMGSAQLGIFLGSLLLLPGNGPALDSDLVVVALCAVFTLFASFAPAGNGERPEGHPAMEANSTEGSTVFADEAVASSMDNACAAISNRFGLSEREREVLLLLARGHSRAYIRDALFISKNTIATHARHIYQKTGTHSQQELIVLVESYSSSQNGRSKP